VHPRVAIVPALNEEATVAESVRALLHSGAADHVIVVDDGSTDSTGAEAEQAGATVIRMAHTSGKGSAVATGVARAQHMNPKLLVFADADLGTTASEMASVVSAVVSGRGDMAVAGFPSAKNRGGFGLVVGLARRGIRRLTGLDLKWPLSGQRAISAERFYRIFKTDGALGLRLERGFGLEVGLAIDWARAGYSIVEVPTEMMHRETGRDLPGILHRARQFKEVMRALATRCPQ
jgi:hypothetical protein